MEHDLLCVREKNISGVKKGNDGLYQDATGACMSVEVSKGRSY